MEGRSDRVEDPLNLADMIKSVTRAYESRTRSTIHDLHQPRGTPAIQLSPSPELERLPTFSSVLSADGDRDPDSMDWEPTEPAASDPALHPNALHSHSSGASSVWDRFATAKQRIFARGQLTGLERAFESWKDLGTSLNIDPTPSTQRVRAPSTERTSRLPRKTLRPMLSMLASVLRVLSLAITLRMSSDVGSTQDDFIWFRIAASVLEAGCAVPQLIRQRKWSLQVCGWAPRVSKHSFWKLTQLGFLLTAQSILPIMQTSLAFLYLVARLSVAQIVLSGMDKSVRRSQVCIADGCMALIDLTACCLL